MRRVVLLSMSLILVFPVGIAVAQQAGERDWEKPGLITVLRDVAVEFGLPVSYEQIEQGGYSPDPEFAGRVHQYTARSSNRYPAPGESRVELHTILFDSRDQAKIEFDRLRIKHRTGFGRQEGGSQTAFGSGYFPAEDLGLGDGAFFYAGAWTAEIVDSSHRAAFRVNELYMNQGAATVLIHCGNTLWIVRRAVVSKDERTPSTSDQWYAGAEAASRRLSQESIQPATALAAKLATILGKKGICGCKGPRITLDRTVAARFSALKLTGGGFQKGDNLKITFNGREMFQVGVQADGMIPKDTWIWVPDYTSFGVNKVQAEVKGKDTRSNTVELNVEPLSGEQLVSNFNEVVRQYRATIPRNERWYAFTRSGKVRNFLHTGGSVVAPVAWLVTTVFTFGTYRADIWPDDAFVCSDYQSRVLHFLNAMRFDPDPARRVFLDGLDYGPFNSGAETPPLAHFFVVMWPHTAALKSEFGGGDVRPTYEYAGVCFDPWPLQTPEIFEMKSGTGYWVSSPWKIDSQYSYLVPRPEPASFGYNQGDYPVTGSKYYDPKGKGKLATDDFTGFPSDGKDRDPKGKGKRTTDHRSVAGIGSEPPKMLATHSPVTLELTDAQGHKAGMKPDGELYNDIPGVGVLVVSKDVGGYEWYVALPEGQIEVAVIGTGSGSYRLQTKRAGKPILEYPAVNVIQGATAHLTLDDQTAAAPLRTAAGKELLPVENSLPWDKPTTTVSALPASGGTAGVQGEEGVAGPGDKLVKPAFQAMSARLSFNGINPGYINGDEFRAAGLQLTVSKGRLYVLPAQSPAMVMPAGQGQVLAVKGDGRGGDDRVSEFALEFDPPVRSFTITLPGLRGGASFPTYSITAFNPSGAGVDMVGQEHWIPTVAMPAKITLDKGMMTRAVIYVDNRFGNTAWATYSFLPITEIELQR